jgi:tetratricopeptide (TPR) repeat protein
MDRARDSTQSQSHFLGIYALVLVAIMMMFHGTVQASEQPFEDPYPIYERAEKSQVIADKRELFNQALALYRVLEESHPSAKLLLNIGNCYGQLENYPSAIFYYERALKLQPRNEKIQANLQQVRTLSKIDLPSPNPLKIALLEPFFSLSEKLAFLVGILACGVVLGSMYIWSRWKICKRVAQWLAGLAVLATLNILCTYYLISYEGVLMSSTLLRCDAGEHYAKVLENPLSAGSKVNILQAQTEWVEVSTEEGAKGYVPQRVVCIIPES